MRWFIERTMNQHDIVGLSIAIVHDQDILWAQGFGYADQERDIKATADTLYRAGSVSKLFTATALMALAEDGKVDIDRPLSDYVADFRIRSRFGATDGITIRNLMTHHAGLPGNVLHGMWTTRPAPFATVVDHLRDEYVAYPPNKLFSYSNVGYTLLGQAIAEFSGRPYAEYMAATLLADLGMTTSAFAPGLGGAGAARAYKGGEPVAELPLRDVPAGGLNTNVRDLSRLVMMVNGTGQVKGKQIINAGTLAEMHRVQNAGLPLDGDFRIGLGWIYSDHLLGKPERVLGHGGATIAHRASLLVVPDQKLGVVLLANSAEAGAQLNEIAKQALLRTLAAKSGRRGAGVQAAGTAHKPEPAAPSAAMAGHYMLPTGLAEVRGTADHYRLEAFGRSFDLQPAADGRYYLSYRWLGLIPVDLGDFGKAGVTLHRVGGHQVLFGELDGLRQLVAEKVQPPTVEGVWLQRLGHYEIVEDLEVEQFQVESVEFKLEDGFLVAAVVLRSGDKTRFALRPVDDNHAVIMGLGHGLGETVHVDGVGDDTRFRYAGLRFRRKP